MTTTARRAGRAVANGRSGARFARRLRMDEPRFARERGFTLVEVMTYLALFATFMATLVAAELLGRRLHSHEQALLQALGQVARLFDSIAEDAERAVRVDVVREAPGRLRLELGRAGEDPKQGVVYAFDSSKATLTRDGNIYAVLMDEVSFERDEARPQLFRVVVRFSAPIDRDRTFQRRFERTYVARGYAAAPAGGAPAGAGTPAEGGRREAF